MESDVIKRKEDMRKEKISARPLTKRRMNGDLYIRPKAVEKQINEVLTLDMPTLKQRLGVAEHQATGYIHSECLVYLIRDALRNNNDAVFNTVLPVLLTRCNTVLLSNIKVGNLPTAVDVREEVMGQFGELLASDGTEGNRDELDYFECRFNRSFYTFYTDLVRSEKARLKPLVFLSDNVDGMESSPSFEVIPIRTLEALRSQDTTDSSVQLREIYEAIDSLLYDERKAVILFHVMGYKIESNNPNEMTVAKICKVSGRTIRNRLARAAEKLSQLKEETRP